MTRTVASRRSARRPAPKSSASTVHYRILPSPDGDFYFAVCDGKLLETGWTDMRKPIPTAWKLDARLEPTLAAELKRALAGQEADFSAWTLPSAAPFTATCRRIVQRLPRGTTISYGELASRAGNAAAARAAGQAMRRNPTPIVVPCHRVIGSNGALHGFGGESAVGCLQLDLKARLLERERKAAQGR